MLWAAEYLEMKTAGWKDRALLGTAGAAALAGSLGMAKLHANAQAAGGLADAAHTRQRMTQVQQRADLQGHIPPATQKLVEPIENKMLHTTWGDIASTKMPAQIHADLEGKSMYTSPAFDALNRQRTKLVEAGKDHYTHFSDIP